MDEEAGLQIQEKINATRPDLYVPVCMNPILPKIV